MKFTMGNSLVPAQILRYIGMQFPTLTNATTKDGSESKSDRSINREIDRMIETLPDHPFRDVVKLLIEGAVSGQINREQLAHAMKNYSSARANTDVNNLPEVIESDGILAAIPDYQGRLHKATRQLNKELAKRFELYIEFPSSSAVISDRSHPRTRIAVAKDGTLSAYQGRPDHRAEYRPLSVEYALSILER